LLKSRLLACFEAKLQIREENPKQLELKILSQFFDNRFTIFTVKKRTQQFINRLQLAKSDGW